MNSLRFQRRVLLFNDLALDLVDYLVGDYIFFLLVVCRLSIYQLFNVDFPFNLEKKRITNVHIIIAHCQNSFFYVDH